MATVREVEEAALGVALLTVPEALVKTTVLLDAVELKPVPVSVSEAPTAALAGEIEVNVNGVPPMSDVIVRPNELPA